MGGVDAYFGDGYGVVTGSLTEMSKEVDRRRRDGWMPLGGVSHYKVEGVSPKYAQAMVKSEVPDVKASKVKERHMDIVPKCFNCEAEITEVGTYGIGDVQLVYCSNCQVIFGCIPNGRA